MDSIPWVRCASGNVYVSWCYIKIEAWSDMILINCAIWNTISNRNDKGLSFCFGGLNLRHLSLKCRKNHDMHIKRVKNSGSISLGGSPPNKAIIELLGLVHIQLFQTMSTMSYAQQNLTKNAKLLRASESFSTLIIGAMVCMPMMTNDNRKEDHRQGLIIRSVALGGSCLFRGNDRHFCSNSTFLQLVDLTFPLFSLQPRQERFYQQIFWVLYLDVWTTGQKLCYRPSRQKNQVQGGSNHRMDHNV